MPDRLPKGWVKTTLGEVVDILDSQRVPVNSEERSFRRGTIPYYGATGQAGWIDTHLFDEELVLLGEDGAPFLDSDKPKAYIIRGKSWVNNHAHVLRASPGVLNPFVLHQLNQVDYRDFISGTTRTKLPQGSMRRIPLVVAPSREQERIVGKLDGLLSRVAAGEAAARRALHRLQRYRSAVLHAAVTGELTRDWRKTNKPEESGVQLLKRLLKVRRSRWELNWLIGKLSQFVAHLKEGKRSRSRISIVEQFLRRLCSFRDTFQALSSWDGDWHEQWNEFRNIENVFESTAKQSPSVNIGVTRYPRGFGYLQSGHWKSQFYSEPKPPQSDAFTGVPRSWALASIDQLGWSSGYGTSVKCTNDAKGPAVLRIPNIRNRGFDFTDLKFATKPKEIAEGDFVVPGDFLLIRTNGSIDLIGRAGIATSALEKECSFASYLIRFRLVGDKTLWSMISLAWDSHKVRSAIQARAATTAGQYNVSLSGLADLALPLPPAAEQKEIVRQVERRLASADRLAATLNRQLERAQVTRQSLLREAFAGNLVPQNPSDEPASALLERIRAAREAEAKKPKAKRMPKPKLKSVKTLEQLEGLIHDLGKAATPERVLLAARLGEDVDTVEKFFDLLRAGRDKGSLVVPVGKRTAIRRVQHAN